jgi:hypothetical protein
MILPPDIAGGRQWERRIRKSQAEGDASATKYME